MEETDNSIFDDSATRQGDLGSCKDRGTCTSKGLSMSGLVARARLCALDIIDSGRKTKYRNKRKGGGLTDEESAVGHLTCSIGSMRNSCRGERQPSRTLQGVLALRMTQVGSQRDIV